MSTPSKAVPQEMTDVIAAIGAETTRVAQLVTDQASQIKAGMTQEEAAAVTGQLNGIADQLRAIGSDPNNPVPVNKKK